MHIHICTHIYAQSKKKDYLGCALFSEGMCANASHPTKNDSQAPEINCKPGANCAQSSRDLQTIHWQGQAQSTPTQHTSKETEMSSSLGRSSTVDPLISLPTSQVHSSPVYPAYGCAEKEGHEEKSILENESPKESRKQAHCDYSHEDFQVCHYYLKERKKIKEETGKKSHREMSQGKTLICSQHHLVRK